MSNTDANQPSAAGSPVEQELGQALEDAAYDCMSALAGVDTYDVNLRDHPQAWAAIEAFAAKVKAAERERCNEIVAVEQLYPNNPDAAIVNPSIHRAMQRIEAGTTLDDLRRECRGEKA